MTHDPMHRAQEELTLSLRERPRELARLMFGGSAQPPGYQAALRP
jgi:hypothetical protein